MGLGFPQPSPRGTVENSSRNVVVGDGWWQCKKCEQASRGYEFRSPTAMLCKQHGYVYRQSFDRGMRFVSKTNTQMSSGN